MRDGVWGVERRLLASDIFLERVGLKERSGGRCPQGNDSRRSDMLAERHSMRESDWRRQQHAARF